MCSHPQSRLCRNLRYSLAHLKVTPWQPPADLLLPLVQSQDKAAYLGLLDSVVMGPSTVSPEEAEALLSVPRHIFQ